MTINELPPLMHILAEGTSCQLAVGIDYQNREYSSEIGARILFALQLVTTIISLPIILAIGLAEVTFLAVTLEPRKIIPSLQLTMRTFTFHLVEVLPLSLIGIFTTKQWVNDVGQTLRSFSEGISNILWKSSCCSTDN